MDLGNDARTDQAHSEPSPARTVRAVRRDAAPFAEILPRRILGAGRRVPSLQFLPRDFLPLLLAPATFPPHKLRLRSSLRDRRLPPWKASKLTIPPSPK